MNVSIVTNVNSGLLATEIAYTCKHEDIVNFIKKLDLACQDWYVT